MNIIKMKFSILAVLAFLLSGCISTASHNLAKESGYSKSISINSTLSDKAFVEKVHLFLVRQPGFENQQMQMKSDELKMVVVKHAVSYNNIPLIACNDCYVQIRTEVTRTAKDKALVKHSNFTPFRQQSTGFRPLIREGLMNNIKKKLDVIDLKIEKTLLE